MAEPSSKGRYRLVVLALMLTVTISAASGCAQPANVLETTTAGQQAMAASPSPESTPTRRHVSSRSVPTSKIEILNLGSEPREVLRLPLAKGTTHAVRLSRSGQQRFSLKDQTGWMDFPTIRVDYRLTVLESDGSTARVKVQIDRALATGGSKDPVVQTYADAVLNGFKGSTEVKMLQSGALFGTEPVIGPGDPSELLALGPLQRDVVTLADPLPVAAIGIGARWRITTPETLGGLKAAVVNEYTLVEVTDTEIKAEVQQSILLATGEGPDLSLGASTIRGTGYAQWYRSGLVGILNVSTEGTLRFKLSPEAWLEQSLTEAVEMETLELSTPEPEPEADAKPQGDTTPVSGSDAKPTPDDTKPDPDAKPTPDTKPDPDTETKPGSDAKPTPDTKPDPAADAEPEPESSADAKPEPATKDNAEPKPDKGQRPTRNTSAGPNTTEQGNDPNN